MKHVLFVVVIAIAALAVGCQDSNTTGPVSNSGHQLYKPSPSTGILYLKGDVAPSNSGTPDEGVFHVNGALSYEYKFVGPDEDPGLELSTNMQAELVPENPFLPLGTASGESVDLISQINKEEGPVYIEKAYFVQELNTKFHVRIVFSGDSGLSIDAMWIDDFNSSEVSAK